MNEAFTEKVSIEKYMKKALDLNEFELYYQPQLDLKTNRITGLEALLRWNSPDLGPVPTLKFISVAEDTHFIIPLGDWVLQNACIFIKKLEEMGYLELGVSVNISILQLLQDDFIDKVMNIIHSYQINPELLELEITESILVESFERIKAKLQKLRDHHVRIALDDFGKGYSSLSYLKQLPITTMKIDKSFIDYISDQNEDDFVRNIISMGKDLGMSVIAEGVEVKHQLDYLMKNDCDKIQGFYFCKPKTEDGIIQMIKLS
jgi:EAL domain-containing protein (putative c-di-GMP-specific phosphodiesterase class I)